MAVVMGLFQIFPVKRIIRIYGRVFVKLGRKLKQVPPGDLVMGRESISGMTTGVGLVCPSEK